MQQVINFKNVTKIYKLGISTGSLRSTLAGISNRVLNKDFQGTEYVTALDQVSFSIEKGESIGFIGPNGSGKTTTLKLISNITRCTQGKIRIDGRISALIELGAGFHPDLTGRENIYFNAAILGMRQHEVQQRFDEIVDFSGLERFLDTPVKRYSSGMYARLGFAVAAHVNPNILLVDEVLAVGDASFQNRCLRRMSELRAEGTTIVFVTHNMGYLQRLCNRAIFLHNGKIITDSSVSEAIQTYRDHSSYSFEKKGDLLDDADFYSKDLVKFHEKKDPQIKITDVVFSNGYQQNVGQIETGSALTMHIEYNPFQPIEDVNFEVWIYGIDGTEYASFATAWDAIKPINLDKPGKVSLHFNRLCLMPGTYFVNVAISDQDGLNKYDMHWEKYKLKVLSGPISYGLVYQPHEWLVDINKLGPA